MASESNGSSVSSRPMARPCARLAGLTLVVWHKLGGGEITMTNLSLAIFALRSITIARCTRNVTSGRATFARRASCSCGAAFAVSLPLALLLETEAIDWHPQLIGALGWSVIALTLGRQLAAVHADPARRRHRGHEPAVPRAAVHGGDGVAAVR